MDEPNIGDPNPAVFVGVEWDETVGWLAAFVTRYGDTFALASPELSLRIRYLQQNDVDSSEERKAQAALRRQ